MYNPYASSNYGYDPMWNNRAAALNTINTAEGNPLATPVTQSAQNKLIGQVVSPMPIANNSNMVNIGQQLSPGISGVQDVGIPQVQHGLIGRTFSNAKNNYLPFGGQAGVQQRLQTAMTPQSRDQTTGNVLQKLNQNSTIYNSNSPYNTLA